MNKTELISKIKKTNSLVEFFKLKESILEQMEPSKTKEKVAPLKVENKEDK